MKRIAALVTVIGLTAFGATPSWSQSPPIGISSFSLGMTIEEAKALPLQATAGGRATVRCSGDRRSSQSAAPSKAEQSVGLVKCFPHGGPLDLFTFVKLGTGELSSGVVLLFYENRLTQITAVFNMRQRDLVVDALSTRFGPPTTVEEGSTLNGFGQELPKTAMSWTLDGGSIELTAPAGRVDEFTVVYSDARAPGLMERVRAAEVSASGI